MENSTYPDYKMTGNLEKSGLYMCLASKRWFHVLDKGHWISRPNLRHSTERQRKSCYKEYRLILIHPRCSNSWSSAMLNLSASSATANYNGGDVWGNVFNDRRSYQEYFERS